MDRDKNKESYHQNTKAPKRAKENSPQEGIRFCGHKDFLY
jgi:hypothetical protein